MGSGIMGGGILMIGGSAATRIVLKARLGGSCYHLHGVAEADAGLKAAATGAHDAALVMLDPADAGAPDLVRRLRAVPALAEAPILALGAGHDDPALRLAVLEAGADDVLPTIDAALLGARLRALLRHRAALSDLGAHGAPMQALGFCEAQRGYAPPGEVVLVMDRSEVALRLRRDLGAHLPDRLCILTPAEARSGPVSDDTRPAPDLFVVDGAAGMDGALRLVAELRSHETARHAAFCVLRSGTAAQGDAMAFDMGVGDLLDPEGNPRELALRMSRTLARKREGDRLRASVRDGLRLAVIDPLTGLYNRRYAVGRLDSMAEAASAGGFQLAVMILDLDRFKRVNDDWGHAAGDAVLVQVAHRLADTIRPGDLLARIGGEEFLIALPNAGLDEARAVAERLCATLQQSPVTLPQGQTMVTTGSIGLAVSDPKDHAGPGPRGSETVQALLDRADRALLLAKAAGRNQVTVGRDAA